MDSNATHSDSTPNRDFVGHTVVDERDHVVGTVVDVAYDDGVNAAGTPSEAPVWLVVDPGKFRADHWVPVIGTYRSASDSIVIPWDRDVVKHSPKASDDHLMTPELAHDLASHYEIATLR